MRVVVTGGLGFIGSAVVRLLGEQGNHEILNIDSRTYAATDAAVATVSSKEHYRQKTIDIANGPELRKALQDFGPDAIMHLAAESHVDRSIDGPERFVETNVMGTFQLLEAARSLDSDIRFLHVSTDEVFGSLDLDGSAFNEETAYSPNSPYSATKAASDHLVRAWHETYGLDVVLTNCSNNYGPFQFPEKLIPLMTLKAAAGEALPVYGTGSNIRDWLYVEDHAEALALVLEKGVAGETYAVGGNTERTNLDLVHEICDIVDSVSPRDTSARELVEFVGDRPGHDLRYAIDASKIRDQLGWEPKTSLAEGLESTVQWYLANEEWWHPLLGERQASLRRGVA